MGLLRRSELNPGTQEGGAAAGARQCSTHQHPPPGSAPSRGQPHPEVGSIPALSGMHSCSSSGRETWGSPSQELCQGKPSPAQGCCQQSPAARPGPVLPVGMQQADSSFCAVPSSGDTQCIKRRSRSGLFSKGEMASYHQGGDQVSSQTRAQHPHLAVVMPEDAQLALAPQLWVLWDGGELPSPEGSAFLSSHPPPASAAPGSERCPLPTAQRESGAVGADLRAWSSGHMPWGAQCPPRQRAAPALD